MRLILKSTLKAFMGAAIGSFGLCGSLNAAPNGIPSTLIRDCSDRMFQENTVETTVIGENPGSSQNYDVDLRIPNDHLAGFSGHVSRKTDGVNLEFAPDDANDIPLFILLHDQKDLNEVVPILIRSRTGVPIPHIRKILEESTLSVADGLSKITKMIPLWSDQDFFVNGSLGHWEDAISCSTLRSVVKPRCSHMFEFRKIDVTLTYTSDLLPNWRTIRSAAQSYLSCVYIGDHQVRFQR